MLDTNVTVDDDAQLFETHRKINQGTITTVSHILFKYNFLQSEHNNISHRKGHKIPPFGM